MIKTQGDNLRQRGDQEGRMKVILEDGEALMG